MPGEPVNLQEQLARRDRFLQRQWMAMTPAERFHGMMELQQRTWDLLRSSPEGYAHFLRRNYQARAIHVERGHAT